MAAKREVPFFNYSALFAEREDAFLETMRDVCQRGAYILQRDLIEFEKNLSEFINTKYVFGVANGTDALIIALRAAGIKPGDEVILPSHTYIATAAAVHFAGATPVLVECGSDHMMDPASAKKAVTKKTRALMPVQINGRTCNMDTIQAIADKYNLFVIEDAAQGLGSKFKERFAGTFGIAGTFSFYPAKVLGCFGDGGAVVTNNAEVAAQVTLLRDHGRNEQGRVITWGFNSRLDNLQAAILNLKLKTYKQDIAHRRELAAFYHDALKDVAELHLPPPPLENSDHFDVYQNYEIEAEQRDKLRLHLEKEGIKTIIQWAGTPIHQFKELKLNFSLPLTDKMFTRCMMLPMNTSLARDDIDFICCSIRQFYGYPIH